MAMILAFVTIPVFVASWAFTGWFRRLALAHLLVDVPNARSLHTVVTPRAGGVAIVLTTLVTLLLLGWKRQLDWSTVSSLCFGGTLVALIGFADDRASVSPRWRILGHFCAAALVVAHLGGAPPVRAMGLVLNSGWLGFAIAVLYVVWILNLTNFMDGIDGLAGVEVITVCLSAILLTGIVAPGSHLWIAPLVLASATLGFLTWNWPPAKIFLGDAGSGFLGFVLAVLSLQAGWVDNRLFWIWVILLAVFVVDATVTLVRRMTQGERFYEAHRTHAYQHVAMRWGAHGRVTVAVSLINIFWLLPVALPVALGRLDGIFGALISYTPLVVLAVWLQAGSRH